MVDQVSRDFKMFEFHREITPIPLLFSPALYNRVITLVRMSLLHLVSRLAEYHEFSDPSVEHVSGDINDGEANFLKFYRSQFQMVCSVRRLAKQCKKYNQRLNRIPANLIHTERVCCSHFLRLH